MYFLKVEFTTLQTTVKQLFFKQFDSKVSDTFTVKTTQCLKLFHSYLEYSLTCLFIGLRAVPHHGSLNLFRHNYSNSRTPLKSYFINITVTNTIISLKLDTVYCANQDAKISYQLVYSNDM